ncbi:MAG: DUF4381 family protein [Desulfobacterales bacterium]
MLRIFVCLLFFFPLLSFAEDKPVTPLIPPDVMKELQKRNVSPPVGPAQSRAAETADDAAPMTDIHDIKPPEPAGFDPMILWYVLGAVLILVLLLGIIYWFRHRKKRVKAMTVPSLPPHEAALLALNELSDVENMEGKNFYFRISAIVRHYLEGRFGINAPEMTTEELLPCIDRLEMDRDLHRPLKNLFQAADPVKFAGMHAVAKSMQEHLLFAIKLVKETAQEAGEQKMPADAAK